MAKILIVEDNDMNLDMLSRRLARKGFEIETAQDGLQGVATAAASQPDLILMDISLPGIDGHEATKRLKADDSTAAIPVVALTAHALTSDRDAAMAAGCDEFFTKPIELPGLLEIINKLLSQKDM